MRVILACALGALLGACGVPVTADSGVDSGVDSGAAEAGTDATADTGIDATTDTGIGPPECSSMSTRFCYDGPPGTRNLGACRDGSQECRAGRWGPCVGQALPRAEVCGNDLDEDCNGSLLCPGDVVDVTDVRDVASDAPRPDCNDADGDGYGVGAGCLGIDCDDSDRTSHPGAEERCDGADNNCNGVPDSSEPTAMLDAWCVASAGAGITATSHYTPVCLMPSRTLPSSNYRSIGTRTACQSCFRGLPGGCGCWRDRVSAFACP